MTNSSGFHAQTCRCGHTVGEHKSGGTHWPHPPRFGVCLAKDCGCREFEERKAA